MDKWEEKQKKYLTFFENNALIRKAILNTQGRITDINVRQQIYLYTMCPVIAMFSKWVIEEAVKRDIKKLYFMARDSYTAYLTDDYIIKKYHIDIQIKYIRLSRHSLRHSEYKNIITYLKKEGFFDDFDMSISRYFVCNNHAISAILLAAFMPSSAEDVMPPAYPAPSPQG